MLHSRVQIVYRSATQATRNDNTYAAGVSLPISYSLPMELLMDQSVRSPIG